MRLIPWLRPAVLLVLMAMTAARSADAGTFVSDLPSYQTDLNPGTILVVVNGSATYQGVYDYNDDDASIQTTAFASNGDPNGSTGNGYAKSGPFFDGYRLLCTDAQNGCPGRVYIERPDCRFQPQPFYRGQSVAAIYHQFFPEISSIFGQSKGVPCLVISQPSPGPPDEPCGDVEVGSFVVPVIGGPQLAHALPANTLDVLRRETRGSIEFTMDEWAILAVDKAKGRVVRVEPLAASTNRYAAFRRDGLVEGIDVTRVSPEGAGRWELLGKGSLESYYRPGRSILLAVDEPLHPHNHRWIEKPIPRLRNGEIPAPGDDALAVVRAEYDESRSLDSLEVLYSERPLNRNELSFLGSHLALEYSSDRTHRAVLFALVHLGETPSLQGSKVVLPECCCPSSGPGEPCGPETIAADSR